MTDEFRKPCSKCKNNLPLASFYRSSRAKDGRTSECADCLKLRNKAYREVNSDKIRTMQSAWVQANRDRVRDNRRKHYLSTRDQLLPQLAQQHLERVRQGVEALGGRCAWCGEGDWRKLQFDHLNDDGNKDRTLNGSGTPWVRKVSAYGWSAWPYVLQLLCGSCHTLKTRRLDNPNDRCQS